MERTNNVKGKQKLGIIICLACIFYVTLFSRTPTLTRSVHWDPLWSYLSRGNTEQIFLNIALFIPLGYFLASFFVGRKHPILFSLITGLTVSVCVETVQFLTYRGMLDVDDLLSNALGTVVGILIWRVMQGFPKNKTISWLMIFAGFTGCIMVSIPTAESKWNTRITQQFDFSVSSVSQEEEILDIKGICYTYDRVTPSYDIFVGGTKTVTTIDGNKYQAIAGKIEKKAEVQISFRGYDVMPTGIYLRLTGDGIKVEYVAGDVNEPNGLPAGAVLKAYSEEHDVLVYQDGDRILWLIGRLIDRNTEVICHIHTTEPEKLPEGSIQNKFENRGFRVPAHQKAGNELEGIDHYRVFQQEIPSEYNVSAIAVGFNTDGEITWRDSFRVD